MSPAAGAPSPENRGLWQPSMDGLTARLPPRGPRGRASPTKPNDRGIRNARFEKYEPPWVLSPGTCLKQHTQVADAEGSPYLCLIAC